MTTKDSKCKNMGGKKKAPQKLKNILAHPFPQYWPELTPEQAEDLKSQILETQKTSKGSGCQTDEVIIGLSKIVREINHETGLCFCLSTEIKPKFVITQIINLTLSRYNSCTVLCVPNLKAMTKSLFGIESIAFGYKTDQGAQAAMWIRQTQEALFPIPKRILNYYSRPAVQIKNISNRKSNTSNSKVEVTVNSLYLNRSTSECAFVPENAKSIKPLEFDTPNIVSNEWSDFISFSVKSNEKAEQMEVDDDDDNIECAKQKLTDTINDFISTAKSQNSDGSLKTKVYGNGISKKSNSNKAVQRGISGNNSQYIGLTVSRIRPNPGKIKKKKNKKKK